METVVNSQKPDIQGVYFDIRNIPDIEIIERELYNVLSDSKGFIREMCSYILSAGGKRLRPLLVLYSGYTFSGCNKKLIQAAAAAELIHMASLVHDDIIDDSGLRHNRLSVYKKWGSLFSVLCGDYLFAKAFGILASNRLIESMDLMVEAIQSMCRGEIIQAGLRYKYDIGIDEYFELIFCKSAILISNCCKSGAVVAGADDIKVKAIGEYGLFIGTAFQIIDDILDISGDTSVLGKPIGEDLKQGNLTLPVIYLLQDKKYRMQIKTHIVNRDFTPQVIDDIKEMLNESGSIQMAFNTAKTYITRAKESLELLPRSDYTRFLQDLADKLQHRMN